MSQRTLNGTIALDRLAHVVMIKKGRNGQDVKGIFIPLEVNKLEEQSYQTQAGTVEEIQLPVRIIVKDKTDDKGQDGFITKTIGSKTYKAASEEQKKAYKDFKNEETKKLTPILGNIKDFSKQQTNLNQSASNAPVDEDDDLPF